MISLTIDGKEIKIEDGATILEASKKAGMSVPTLCYDKRLSPFGACRICLVELEGARTRFTPSCTTPATNGMVIRTTTPAIIKARRTILELLLINHPLDCPVCDKAGECKLQDLVYEYGVAENRFKGIKSALPVDHRSPLIERDLNRCILCGRCARICDELQGVAEISFVHRGMKTKIGTDFDRPLDCEFCGQCISVCPVGALTSKLFKYKARSWELKNTQTICGYCGCGCTLVIGTKQGVIKRASQDPEAGMNEGNLCIKGRFGWGYVQSEERLKTPLIIREKGEGRREKGEFREVGWDEALEVVAHRFKEIKQEYGPDSIAGLASPRLTNEELYLFQKFMRTVVGTNNIDNSSGYEYLGLYGLVRSFGLSGSTSPFSEIRHSDVILLVGADPSSTHPLAKIEINLAVNRKKARLIVANPLKIKLNRIANISLLYNPGTEITLLNGMAWVIIDEGLTRDEFIKDKTCGLKELKVYLSKYTPEYTSGVTGVKKELIIESARVYAKAKQASILVSGNEKLASASANLALLTGNIGRLSAGVHILLEKNNSQGAVDMGVLPGFLPGYQNIKDDETRKRFKDVWGIEPPSENGLGAYGIFKGIEEGGIKALYILGENPVRVYPGAKEALGQLEFLVVQELFLTETAKLADVVLPAVSFAEKDGSFTNTETRVQRLNKAIPQVGEARPDWQIISGLAQKMGADFMRYNSQAEIMDEIKKVVPIYASVEFGNPWRLDGFRNGKAKLLKIEPEGIKEKIDKEYPFTLLTGSLLFHSGTLSLWSKDITKVSSEAYVSINPVDARHLGIDEDEVVSVSSRYGKIGVKVQLSQDLPSGRVFIPIHFKENALRLFKAPGIIEETGRPRFISPTVKIERI